MNKGDSGAHDKESREQLFRPLGLLDSDRQGSWTGSMNFIDPLDMLASPGVGGGGFGGLETTAVLNPTSVSASISASASAFAAVAVAVDTEADTSSSNTSPYYSTVL